MNSTTTQPRRPLARLAIALSLPLLAALLPPAAANAADAVTSATHVARAKNSLGVGIAYTLGATAVGQPTTLTLNTTSSGVLGPVTITVRPDLGLALAGTDLVAGTPRALAAANTFTLTVTPDHEGMLYVNVFLHAGPRARALAIPVPVGDVAGTLNRSQRVRAAADGERVISVPARR